LFFFIGRRLCRFLDSRRLLVLLLLRSALRAEVDGFIGKLLAAVRTELGGFLGQLRTALRAEVGSFIGQLRAAVRARQLFLLLLGMLLAQCALLPCSWCSPFCVGYIPLGVEKKARLLLATSALL
jgi:hypothetical protein